MEEQWRKNLVVFISPAVVLSLIFLFGWVSSCNKVSVYQKARTKEMDMRLDREKQLADLEKAKDSVETNLKKAGEEIAGLKSTLESTQRSLSQEQLMNASLKEELEKINKAKESLEAQLKELLVKGKISDKAKK